MRKRELGLAAFGIGRGRGGGETGLFFFLFPEPLTLKLEERLKTTGRGTLKNNGFLMG